MSALSKKFEYHLTQVANTLMLAMEDSEYNNKFIEMVENREESFVDSVKMLDTLRFGIQSGRVEILDKSGRESEL